MKLFSVCSNVDSDSMVIPKVGGHNKWRSMVAIEKPMKRCEWVSKPFPSTSILNKNNCFITLLLFCLRSMGGLELTRRTFIIMHQIVSSTNLLNKDNRSINPIRIIHTYVGMPSGYASINLSTPCMHASIYNTYLQCACMPSIALRDWNHIM